MHRPIRVLIVDDNEVNRDVATGMLEILQCETLVSKNGYEAVESYNKNSFDLIFMDCQMPELDGYSATRMIRQLESEKRARVPIVALTANATLEAQEKCIEAGMDDYLSKPFSLNAMKEIVAKWVHLEEKTNISNNSESSIRNNFNQYVDEGEVLDQKVLAGLRTLQAQAKNDMFNRVIKLYLDTSDAQLDSLRVACKAKEYEKIGQCAHALKSSSTNIGAIRLSRYLEDLEKNMRAETYNGLEGKLTNIMGEYGLVVSALRKEISY